MWLNIENIWTECQFIAWNIRKKENEIGGKQKNIENIAHRRNLLAEAIVSLESLNCNRILGSFFIEKSDNNKIGASFASWLFSVIPILTDYKTS